MYTDKFFGRILLILVVLLGTMLLANGVTSIVMAEYETAVTAEYLEDI